MTINSNGTTKEKDHPQVRKVEQTQQTNPEDSDFGFGLGFAGKVSKPLQTPPVPPVFESKLEEREYVKFRLAQAFRLFAHWGFDDGVAGHITVRDPVDPTAFWVNPFGVHFGAITPDLLLLVDHQGNMLPESGPIRNLNKAAFMIHSQVHAARADIMCAAHSHSMYGRAFSTLGKNLEIITQNDCLFYDDCVLYDQFNGVVLDEEEGRRIAAALGPSNHAAILQNHGLLTVHQSIEAAVHLFKMLEDSCQCQMLALSAAAGLGIKPIPVSEEEARFTHDKISMAEASWFAGSTAFDWIERNEKGEFGVWNGPKVRRLGLKN